MAEKTQYRAPALEKGLDILETLSVAAVPQTLTDLSKTLKRSPSELFRMITLLESRGYIVKDASGYYLSLKLYELAHTHSPVDHLLRAASQPMRELALSLRESCHLSVLFRGELLVLVQEESPDKVRLSLEVGGRFSVVHTASGRLLLANLSAPEQTTFFQTDPEYAEMTDEEKDWLASEVKGINQYAYSTSEDESHIGIRDYAVLVGNPQIGTMAALTVTSLTLTRNRKQLNEVLNALTACADQITANMGFGSTVGFPALAPN